MKPSEFLIKYKNIKMMSENCNLIDTKYIDLDNQFIDKEELKSKLKLSCAELECQVRNEGNPITLSSLGGYHSALLYVIELLEE